MLKNLPYKIQIFKKDKNNCSSCVQGCQVCQNNKICEVCQPGFYLKQNLCIKCPKECLSCQDENVCFDCIEGYIKLKDKCIVCPNGCSKCSQQVDNTFICQSCFENYFLQEQQCILPKQCKSGYFGEPIERVCSQKCKDGYFQFKLTKKCEKCHPNCSKCFGKEKDNCYECNSLYFFYNFSCESKCPVGTQENKIVWQCNPTTKNSESQNYSDNFKQECYIACQMGKWYNEQLWTCDECDSSCLACEIRNKSECTMCKENQYLDKTKKKCIDLCIPVEYHDSDHRQCQVQCLQGYYAKDQSCYKCEFVGCLKCTEFQCLQCDQSLKRQANQNGECICQDGYYSDGIRDECFKCAPGCKKCTSINECQECETKNDLFLSEGVCKCKLGMYLKDDICVKCHYSCMSCKNEFSCDECKQNTYRYLDTLCVCQKYYLEIPSEQKQECTPYPEGCIELNKNICTKCDKGYVYTLEKECQKKCPKGSYENIESPECIKDCGIGYFPNKQTQKCQKCINDCISCQNDSICEQCQNGIFLLPDIKICSSECPKIGYILQYGQCFKCPSNCKICKNFSTCEECYPPYVTSNTQRCFCLQGSYFNEQSNQCERCPEFCKECKNANICKVCTDQNRELITDDQGNIQCKCKQGYFEDQQTKECIKCMSNCDMCENKESCIKCNDLSYLTEQNICECNSQYFKEDNICKICTLNGCLECKSSLICLKCKVSHQMNKQNQCVLIQKNDEQPNPNNNNGNHNPNSNNNNNNSQSKNLCHVSCQSCTSKEKNKCTSCASSRYLSKERECLCKIDYIEHSKQQQECELSSDIDTTLLKISSTVNLSSLSSSIALGLFSYNINISILNIILCQQVGNLVYVLDYSQSRYYEYQSIEKFQVFNIFPVLPKIQFMSNQNSKYNQDQGQLFDKLIFPSSFLMLLILITLINNIMKNKYKFCNKIYNLFQYNVLLISYTLLSNYIIIESLKFLLNQKFDYLPDLLMSILSLSLVFCLFVQFIYFNYNIYKQYSENDLEQTQPSFLKFVNADYTICRIIWILFDIRRYCIISIIFISSSIKIVLIINIVTSAIFILIFIKRSPFIDDQFNQQYKPQNDTTIHSDLIKMNLFQSSFAVIEEEKNITKQSLKILMNQSRLGYLIEIFVFLYFCLTLANQMYNNIFIAQTSVILILIYCSFVFIMNILKFIQLILNLRNGKKQNQLANKSNILDQTRQQQQFEEFINQLQEQQQNNQNDIPYSIQVKQKFLFSSNKVEKQNIINNDIQNKIVEDKSADDKPNQIQKQNTIFRDKVTTDRLQNQKNFLNSPNRKPDFQFKKNISFNLDKVEKNN